MDNNTGIWVYFTLWHHHSVSFTHETSINSERLQNWCMFLISFFSLTLGDYHNLKKIFRAKLCYFLHHFYWYIQKQCSNQAFCPKKIKLSLCLCLFCSWIKHWDDITKKTRPILLYCRPWAKKTPNFLILKRYNIWRKNPGPKTFHQSNQLIYEKKNWGASGTLIFAQCTFIRSVFVSAEFVLSGAIFYWLCDFIRWKTKTLWRRIMQNCCWMCLERKLA